MFEFFIIKLYNKLLQIFYYDDWIENSKNYYAINLTN